MMKMRMNGKLPKAKSIHQIYKWSNLKFLNLQVTMLLNLQAIMLQAQLQIWVLLEIFKVKSRNSHHHKSHLWIIWTYLTLLKALNPKYQPKHQSSLNNHHSIYLKMVQDHFSNHSKKPHLKIWISWLVLVIWILVTFLKLHNKKMSNKSQNLDLKK